METKKYTWSNLSKIERQPFIQRAYSVINNKQNTVLERFINGKYNPKIIELAEKLFNIEAIDYSSKYMFPVSARELIGRYDILIEEDGVKILTGVDDIDEAKRIKKALILFINTPSEFTSQLGLEQLRKDIKNQIEDVNEEQIFKS